MIHVVVAYSFREKGVEKAGLAAVEVEVEGK